MKKILAGVIVMLGMLLGLAGGLIGYFWSTSALNLVPENLTQGTVIPQEEQAIRQAELANRISSAPPGVMKAGGIAGAMGGSRVKLISASPQEVLLPIPQLGDGQIPLCYHLACTPADALTEVRLRQRGDHDTVVTLKLVGSNQEVQIAWAAAVLIAPQYSTTKTTPTEPYCTATPCVQAQSEPITRLAAATWPETGKPSEFAANIQRHIREMKRQQQPRSLDALGILASGENSICTANANLASALMRSKGIACRSLAVIPPISRKLEMHRIVEFAENGQWHPFDPSSLQTDIPARPWQNVVMARTTIWDEEVAMKQRMGAMVGCPYGHELEMLSPGVTLWGQDFFWTLAKPLAEFEPTEEAARLAAEAWTDFWKTGKMTPGQIKAASAKTAAELVEAIRTR